MFKKLAQAIFYGNYFYGCCTVALAVEASMQQNLPLNSIYFYILLYCGTVIFYTYAYIQENTGPYINNRNQWYSTNKKIIRQSVTLLLLTCVATGAYVLIHYYKLLRNITLVQLLPLVATGIIAMAYYGISFGEKLQISTRRTGWFKPFAIGLVWASVVTYMPVLWHQVERNEHYAFSPINLWLFIKNFMYISVLAILFDIKDYAADHNRKLKTFVVRVGLRKTIFVIIIPLTILGFLSLIAYATFQDFPVTRIIINSIPFLLLIIVAWSMQRRKPIIYYLAVIDGLMLVKAICGITAALILKQ
ncbi:MAG: hypothetical protein ABI921_05260 [Panacibacter sp.]